MDAGLLVSRRTPPRPDAGAPMIITLKKVRDGVVLSCIRDRGAAAVQRTGHGGFFALHDLMHYAIETTLGFDRAFFGLVAAGWDFSTFGDKADPRYRSTPWQALHAEHLVNILTQQYRDSLWRDDDLLPLWTDDINRALAAVAPDAAPLTPAQLAAICRAFRGLADRWAAVPMGEHLELRFPPGPPPSAR